MVSLSQIRDNSSAPRDKKDSRVEDYNRSLRAGLKQYRKEKTPELKAQLSSQWRMASQQGVQIDKKLSEEVKKVVGTCDMKSAPLNPVDKTSGSGPCGSQPCSAAVDGLVGGLEQNFRGS